MGKRNKFSKQFKAKVALEAIKGERTANEIASEFEIHVSQVNDWKKRLAQNAGELFDKGTQKGEDAAREQERNHLYQQIGRLQVEMDWLKKIYGLLPICKRSLRLGRDGLL